MSDLHRVTVLGVDPRAASCELEIECINNEDQEVPLEPAFHANLLADLYLLTVLEIGAPVAHLQAAVPRPSVLGCIGVPWFWRYALCYCSREAAEIEAARERLGVELPQLGLSPQEAWDSAYDEQLTPSLSRVEVRRTASWRNEYDGDCAKLELRVPSAAWVEFLVPGTIARVVYGPYTTWDCL